MREAPVRLKASLLCRGDGVAYALIKGLPDAPAFYASLLVEGSDAIPATIVCAGSGLWAVAFPLMDTDRYTVLIRRGGESDPCAILNVSSLSLKVRSKLAYAFLRSKAQKLRDFDTRCETSCASVRFTRVIEDSGEYVARARVDVPRSIGTSKNVTITAVDTLGESLGARPLVLEDCAACLDESGRKVRRITVALRMPASKRPCLSACADGAGFQPGSCALMEGDYSALRDAFALETLSAAHDPSYDAWYAKHKASPGELAAQYGCGFASSPCFSIVVPLYKTPRLFFEEMLQSVLRQSYKNWQLILVNASPDDKDLLACLSAVDDDRVHVLSVENEGIAQNTNAGIRAASGDYLCFLDHDDKIAPDTLFEYAKAINDEPCADVIYCDEDRFDGAGRHHMPLFKPDYSPDLLRAHNYITHFLCLSKSVIDAIGLQDGEYNGAQDYDYTLRATEKARAVVHVPRVLYHWRLHEQSTSLNPDSKSYAREAGRRAVQAHCDRVGISATVSFTDLPFAYRLERKEKNRGAVDIVIPTKDHVELLRPCVTSLLERCSYKDIRIIIVENNSVQDETFAFYDYLKSLDSRIDVLSWPGEFNYSKIVNFGAAHGSAPNILFLNNDTEVISPRFLEEMLGFFDDADVGVVGAKLLFLDGTLQHAGVGVGLMGSADHLFTSLPAGSGGYFERARLPQNLSAVTGACQLVRRSVFDGVGGYTEAFSVGYNDVDFCLKARNAGFRVVFAPDALLYHYEFASRGRDMEPDRVRRAEKEAELLRGRWPSYFEKGDPFLSPNISYMSRYFALREE